MVETANFAGASLCVKGTLSIILLAFPTLIAQELGNVELTMILGPHFQSNVGVRIIPLEFLKVDLVSDTCTTLAVGFLEFALVLLHKECHSSQVSLLLP